MTPYKGIKNSGPKAGTRLYWITAHRAGAVKTDITRNLCMSDVLSSFSVEAFNGSEIISNSVCALYRGGPAPEIPVESKTAFPFILIMYPKDPGRLDKRRTVLYLSRCRLVGRCGNLVC